MRETSPRSAGTTPRLVARCAIVSLGLAVLGCEPSGNALIVQLRSDYVAGLDLVAARTVVADATTLERRTPVVERALLGGADLAAGVSLAELRGLPTGASRVSVELLTAEGTVRARRTVLVQHSANAVVTVIVTRDCQALACPGASDPSDATSCLAGRCVPPTCIDPVSTPDACGSPACEPSECPAVASCARQSCGAGVCLPEPDHGACGTDELCSPVDGCQTAIVDDADAGSSDAGVFDAGGFDAGAFDAGAVLDAGGTPDAGAAPDAGTPDAGPGGCPGTGGLCPTADTMLCGDQVYDGLIVPPGVTISCAPGCTEPLRFIITGTARIAGTIDVSGGRGGDSEFGGAGAGGTPGAAGCGGFAGGRGGNHSAAGQPGMGPGGGGAGGPLVDREFINGGHGGGGGHATSGGRGFMSTFTGTPGAGGGTYGAPMLTTFEGGSGGGGGSGGIGGAMTRNGGSGGGGGGGAVYIDATERVEIMPGGSVIADGAAGGRCQTTGASGGGGAGAGGAIWLSAPTVVNNGVVRAVAQPNCYRNGADIFDGAGGDGRVRVDTADGAPPLGSFDPGIGFAAVR